MYSLISLIWQVYFVNSSEQTILQRLFLLFLFQNMSNERALITYFYVFFSEQQMCHELVKKSLWRTTLLYAYSFIGGFIFCVIERRPESSKQLYSRLAQQLHQNFTTQLNISINKSDFNFFMQKAFDIVTVGNKADWDILSAVGFTMSSLTTVGKCNILNLTLNGQYPCFNIEF